MGTPARTPLRNWSRTRARDRVRAAVGVEPRDVEPQPRRARPQVRVLQPSLVGEQRVVHRPERVLERRRLRRAGGGERARMRRLDGEVAEGDPHRRARQDGLQRRAERALVVAVDDQHGRALGPADVVVRAGGRDGRGGQVAHAAERSGQVCRRAGPWYPDHDRAGGTDQLRGHGRRGRGAARLRRRAGRTRGRRGGRAPARAARRARAAPRASGCASRPCPLRAGSPSARSRRSAARATCGWAAAAGGFSARGRRGRRRAGWRRAGRPATPPRSSSARRRPASVRTSARCGKPPGCRTPNARQVAPFGSKSESCSIAMPSCCLNACWE